MPPNNSPRSDIDQLGYFEGLPFAKKSSPRSSEFYAQDFQNKYMDDYLGGI